MLLNWNGTTAEKMMQSKNTAMPSRFFRNYWHWPDIKEFINQWDCHISSFHLANRASVLVFGQFETLYIFQFLFEIFWNCISENGLVLTNLPLYSVFIHNSWCLTNIAKVIAFIFWLWFFSFQAKSALVIWNYSTKNGFVFSFRKGFQGI